MILLVEFRRNAEGTGMKFWNARYVSAAAIIGIAIAGGIIPALVCAVIAYAWKSKSTGQPERAPR